MAYFYVYAPFNGANWGQNTYCFNNAPHPSRYYCCPIDIGRPNNDVTPIYFYGSSNIRSIRVIFDNQVCNSIPGDPWENALKVELFGQLDAQCYVGALSYSHVANPITTGTQVYNANYIKLGDASPDTCNCNQNFLCYNGVHVHMERSSNGASISLACWAPVYAATTWIYRWSAAC
ncbi:MAG: hypothetical protein BroJett015_11660 [Chloroflexota bacterium]|nr:hypothetical protein [Ardenticatenaceae bacterium]GIK55503.1 MAG: hypothetical protein BroJett015_11660 [Chloroflexota bacterium]